MTKITFSSILWLAIPAMFSGILNNLYRVVDQYMIKELGTEAQAAIGLARAQIAKGSDLDNLLVQILRDLWVLMAELATLPENRDKLEPETSLTTSNMVERLEEAIDEFSEKFEMPNEFIVPGQNPVAAHFDFARTVVRRAERAVLAIEAEDSNVMPYLNRLSDLMWIIARTQEKKSLTAKEKKE